MSYTPYRLSRYIDARGRLHIIMDETMICNCLHEWLKGVLVVSKSGGPYVPLWVNTLGSLIPLTGDAGSGFQGSIAYE